MGFLQRLFRGQTSSDAPENVYRMLMQQSRLPVFYGKDRFPDSYSGRLECLTLHMALYMKALRDHGEIGKSFSQSIFDSMVRDFDTALREEGLTDSGVKRRIKPMVGHFYKFLKDLTESLGDEALFNKVLSSGTLGSANLAFNARLFNYCNLYEGRLSKAGFEELALGLVDIPDIAD